MTSLPNYFVVERSSQASCWELEQQRHIIAFFFALSSPKPCPPPNYVPQRRSFMRSMTPWKPGCYALLQAELVYCCSMSFFLFSYVGCIMIKDDPSFFDVGDDITWWMELRQTLWVQGRYVRCKWL